MYKVFVICPKESTYEIINAMAEAGAGVIGNYTHNAFITTGMGNWFNSEGTNPTVGVVGKKSREEENKVEMVCPEDKLESVISAIKETHPYETPAIDVYKLEITKI